MFTVPSIQRKLAGAFTEKQASLLAEVVYDAYRNLVTVGDFNELKEIVRDLGQAQQRTEQRLETLTQRVDELAQAQQRTEQRLETLTQRVDELAQAQQRTECRLEELAQAQQRTERRLEELAQAQQRTERRLETVAEALLKLTEEHKETRKQLGGLSMTVGYILEDQAFKALPRLLERDFGLVVQGRLKRDYVADAAGRPIEVNILGQATRDGQTVTIVGEGKSQLSKNAVNEFIRRKLNHLKGVLAEVFPVLVTYMTSEPDVQEYARQKGIALYYSYDF